MKTVDEMIDYQNTARSTKRLNWMPTNSESGYGLTYQFLRPVRNQLFYDRTQVSKTALTIY